MRVSHGNRNARMAHELLDHEKGYAPLGKKECKRMAQVLKSKFADLGLRERLLPRRIVEAPLVPRSLRGIDENMGIPDIAGNLAQVIESLATERHDPVFPPLGPLDRESPRWEIHVFPSETTNLGIPEPRIDSGNLPITFNLQSNADARWGTRNHRKENSDGSCP